MARIGRVVIPGVPHHITQRGVRSQNIFWNDTDKLEYLRLLKRQGERFGIEFIGYCLMTNHVHLVAIPEGMDSLSEGIGEAHRLYTRGVNFREGVRGHLFQERFFSCPLDEAHKIAALRYVERNPVRAGISENAWDYYWSSAKYHTGLTTADPLLKNNGFHYSAREWQEMLRVDPEQIMFLRKRSKTGRPCGNVDFIRNCESVVGKSLLPKKPGPKWENN